MLSSEINMHSDASPLFWAPVAVGVYDAGLGAGLAAYFGAEREIIATVGVVGFIAGSGITAIGDIAHGKWSKHE